MKTNKIATLSLVALGLWFGALGSMVAVKYLDNLQTTKQPEIKVSRLAKSVSEKDLLEELKEISVEAELINDKTQKCIEQKNLECAEKGYQLLLNLKEQRSILTTEENVDNYINKLTRNCMLKGHNCNKESMNITIRHQIFGYPTEQTSTVQPVINSEPSVEEIQTASN